VASAYFEHAVTQQPTETTAGTKLQTNFDVIWDRWDGFDHFSSVFCFHGRGKSIIPSNPFFSIPGDQILLPPPIFVRNLICMVVNIIKILLFSTWSNNGTLVSLNPRRSWLPWLASQTQPDSSSRIISLGLKARSKASEGGQNLQKLILFSFPQRTLCG
jgi:hypothetical protein